MTTSAIGILVSIFLRSIPENSIIKNVNYAQHQYKSIMYILQPLITANPYLVLDTYVNIKITADVFYHKFTQRYMHSYAGIF